MKRKSREARLQEMESFITTRLDENGQAHLYHAEIGKALGLGRSQVKRLVAAFRNNPQWTVVSGHPVTGSPAPQPTAYQFHGKRQ